MEHFFYSIYDLSGNIAGQGWSTDRSVNIQDLPNGVYILNLIIEDTVVNKKFLVEQ
jgi:hypothetical protein